MALCLSNKLNWLGNEVKDRKKFYIVIKKIMIN